MSFVILYHLSAKAGQTKEALLIAYLEQKALDPQGKAAAHFCKVTAIGFTNLKARIVLEVKQLLPTSA